MDIAEAVAGQDLVQGLAAAAEPAAAEGTAVEGIVVVVLEKLDQVEKCVVRIQHRYLEGQQGR